MNIKELAFSIVLQAIEDYKLLREHNMTSYLTKEGDRISISQIREFFLHPYCDQLVELLDLTGKDILTYLDNQYN